MFILDRIDRELHSLERLELKFGFSSEFFDKIPVRILLDVLFCAFRFSNASFYAAFVAVALNLLYTVRVRGPAATQATFYALASSFITF